MDVETCVTWSQFDICFKKQTKKYIFSTFFGLFFQPFLAPKLLKLSVYFFNDLVLKNWSLDMHLNPVPIL